jgi:glutathione synthase/RimK-type ligase-like ATP-grasp enzyme
MPSDRQIAANRNNAKKSTGPRSKAGREISRRNARRHGLAIDIGNDPEFQDAIVKLTNALSSGAQDVGERARETAEAELDLLRIRKVRAWLFETFYLADAALPQGAAELNENLTKLERYERRAFSRRKRALRAMYRSATPTIATGDGVRAQV